MKDLQKVAIGFTVLLLLVIFGVFSQPKSKTEEDPKPAVSLSHIHGLATDPSDSKKLFIATHEGLMVLKDEKDLFSVGRSKDDLMGFQGDYKNPNIFYSSGHPKSGGNSGFQVSEDGGNSWKKLSGGVNGPADFHALAVSPVNSKVAYGSFKGLQKSEDGGKNWQIVNENLGTIINLFADVKDESTVFASTAEGLKISKDKGQNFELISKEIFLNISGNPKDEKGFITVNDKGSVMKSNDGGKNWKIVKGFTGASHFAYSLTEENTIFAGTKENKIYKSIDGGESWKLIY